MQKLKLCLRSPGYYPGGVPHRDPALHGDAVYWLGAGRVCIVVHHPGHKVATIPTMEGVPPQYKLWAWPCLTLCGDPGTWQGGGWQGQQVGLTQEDSGGEGGTVQEGGGGGRGKKEEQTLK